MALKGEIIIEVDDKGAIKSVDGLTDALEQNTDAVESNADAQKKAEVASEAYSKSIEAQEAKIKRLDGIINIVGGTIETMTGALVLSGAVSEEQAEKFESAALGAIALADGAKRVMDGYKTLSEGLKNYGGVVGLAQKAQQALNITTLANPYVLLAAGIAAAGVALYKFAQQNKEEEERRKKAYEELKKEQEALANLRNEMATGAVAEKMAITSLVTVLEDETVSVNEKRNAYEQLKTLVPELEGLTYDQALAEGKLGDAIERQIKLIELRAKARALEDYLVEQEKARIATEQAAEAERKRLAAIKNLVDLQKEYARAQAGGFQGTFEQFEAETKARQALAAQLANQNGQVQEEVGLKGELIAIQKEINSLTTIQTTNVRTQTKAVETNNEANAEAVRLAELKANLEKELAQEAELLDLTEFEKRRKLIEREFQENVQYFDKTSDAYKNAVAIRDAALKEVQTDEDQARDEAILKEQEKNTKIKLLQEQLALELKDGYDLQLANAIAAIQKETDERLAIEGLTAEQIEAIRINSEKKIALATAEIAQQQREARVAEAMGTVDAVQGALGQLFEESKGVAIANVLIDSAQAAIGIFKSSTSLPEPAATINRVIQLAALSASTIASIAKIRSTTKDTTSGTPATATTGAQAATTPRVAGFGNAPGGLFPNPARATNQTPTIKTYVLAGDVTSAQEAEVRIQQRRKL